MNPEQCVLIKEGCGLLTTIDPLYEFVGVAVTKNHKLGGLSKAISTGSR